MLIDPRESHRTVTVPGCFHGRSSGFGHADHIHLGEFYLLPKFQNQGIGTVLLQQVLDEATEKKLPVRLEVLKNNPVRSLYERHEFVITGQREHHFLMERAVS